MGRIFISHAMGDKPLVELFVDLLLQNGLDISRDRIFCTSLEGMKIRPGKTFVEYIRHELSNSDYVIMIITAAYYESAFCLCELGATWVLGSEAFPLLVPPIDYSGMKAVLLGVQAGKIADPDVLNEMKDRLSEAGFGNASTGRWELKRNTFLAQLSDVLTRIPGRTTVSAAEFQTLKSTYDECQKQLLEEQNEIESLKTLIEDLKTCKNRDDVSRILSSRISEGELFDQLVDGIRPEADEIGQTALESIFKSKRGEQFRPPAGWNTEYDWEVVNAAQERGMVTVDSGAVYPDHSHPKIRRFTSKLDKLSEFLQNADNEFIEQKSEEFGFQFSLSNRDFWRRFLNLR